MYSNGNASQQQGYILLVTLIFLSVLSLLILHASEDIILQTKMSRYDQDYAQAFSVAESALRTAELGLMDISLSLPSTELETISVKVTLQGIDSCQCGQYLVDVNSQYQETKIHLQSIYEVIPSVMPANCAHIFKGGHRLWWSRL